MSETTLGAGALSVMFGRDKVLQTRPLGAGVAVIIQDLKSKTSGLVCVVLPNSHFDRERAKEAPGIFADTAVPALLDAFADKGMIREPHEYTVKLVGGANVADQGGSFDLGTRNVQAIQQALEQCKLRVAAAEVGGRLSRAVKIHVESGKVEMISPGRENSFL